MAEGLIKYLGIVGGAILAIIGIGGVPIAVMDGNINGLILYTLLLFLGIALLGWAVKD